MKTTYNLISIGILLCILTATQAGIAQAGCTDPQASNYDANATENDGSCTYPATNYTATELTELSSGLTECSGLAYFNNRLWTQMDGGNPDQIIEIDPLTGSAIEIETVPLADNEDWEDLAADEEHVYIGDFGNNFGNRTDLRIYKIKKADIESGTINPEIIHFTYSDQTDFTSSLNANNYDCEAFFFWNDSLHLFSKNWVDFKTRHYILPATPGTHVAALQDSLAVQGQITAADISADGKGLLLGYNTNTSEAFIWLLFDFQDNQLFSGNKRRISLGSAIFTGQVEGLVFKDSTSGFICSETFSVIPPKLLSFDIVQWLSNPVPTFQQKENIHLRVFPNPAKNILTIQTDYPNISKIQYSIYQTDGRILKQGVVNDFQSSRQINVTELPEGMYWFKIEDARATGISLFQVVK